MLRKAPFCMGDFSKNFFKFLFARRFVVSTSSPGKRRKPQQGSRFLHLFHLRWFDFPFGETKDAIAGKLLFASLPSSEILIFPYGKTEGNNIRSQAEKLFFLQKVFLFATSHWELANSLFKNAPYGKGVSPIAMGDQSLCLWNPRFFEKNRVKLLCSRLR